MTLQSSLVSVSRVEQDMEVGSEGLVSIPSTCDTRNTRNTRLDRSVRGPSQSINVVARIVFNLEERVEIGSEVSLDGVRSSYLKDKVSEMLVLITSPLWRL